MSGILGEIVLYKREFVKRSKKRLPQRELENLARAADKPRGFARALGGKGCALVAEIKTASPSRGLIGAGVRIDAVARMYEENGASCISVLTDERYFGGSLERFRVVRGITTIP